MATTTSATQATTSATTSAYTVTTSAELMENYLQADYLLPQDTFTALQTDSGTALLFSIGPAARST
ncbi:hypothetical protein KDL01_04670 [Actinospica durhamensis]|uniref:Uncharacterized protein n=1 Tax=Actinospica durhamensis TaxID=1508375 RepID=A0A941EKH3_9ACTN|nr:hypothetical protein [Actinospica durhamensis]MBR7832538.1 hypothetical protein [Actinospica durhamensis]